MVLAHLGVLLLFRWLDPPLTIIQVQGAWDGYGLERETVALASISNEMRLAVIAAEDQRFPSHSGFDWNSIRAAMRHNASTPSRIRGGSTISQQVAKNVFLWPERSWLRKGLEAYSTALIEALWGKRRILEIYLNVAEMGPGIFGAQAAARHYFHKPASALDRREAALIAACLPNPRIHRVDKPTRRIRAKARWIRSQMTILAASPEVRALLDR